MYKTYVVGLCNFDDDIQLIKVREKNMLRAMCLAVKEVYNWNVLEENNGRMPFNTTDEAIDYFIQGDVYVSKPMEV